MTRPTRRTVLRGAALASAGTLVGACGSDTGSSAPSTAAPADATGTPTGTAASPPAEAPEGDALVAVADVPVGGGVVVDGTVVVQPQEGAFAAYSAVCTHQACTVSGVVDGAIVCPCHGSRFSVEDGSVLQGPATQPLPEVPVTVAGDQVVTA